MIKILYVGAANLATPSSGTDTASRYHFEELVSDPRLTVDAISVSASPVTAPMPAGSSAQLFTADLATPAAAQNRLRRKLALLTRGGIFFQAGFLSQAARTAIHARLQGAPDILLVDHIAALANISLIRLITLRLQRRTKLVVLAHDVSSDFLRDRASLQKSKLRAFAIRMHAWHCCLYENVVFNLADRVVFISAADRSEFRFVPAAKTLALCQALELPVTAAPAPPRNDTEPTLIFVGSPSFFPNAFAIDWIVEQLAPQLFSRLPRLKILLVGKGTDRGQTERPKNVLGLGFVDDDRLRALLQAASGALSPVIHGSGLKIKVLEAIASSRAIFATEESLRGYEFMGLEALLVIEDPSGSADRIVAIVSNPARLNNYECQIKARWQAHKRSRRGQMADLLHGLMTTQQEVDSGAL